jgi:alkanesulfonate monooxygenase SsuD/methylene tetrahydromethanopterin reductase-like flavin-dependent oxidoreductase (luciferase family)
VLSRRTVAWAAARRYPYIMLDSKLELTAQTFDYYREQARENGYEAGPQHLGYIFKLHVEDTEERAYEVGRKLIEGPGNLFLDGSNAAPNLWVQSLPGLYSRDPSSFLPTASFAQIAQSRGLDTATGEELDVLELPATDDPAEHERRRRQIWDSLLERRAAIVGTPDSVLPKIREVLERVRPGNIFFWHGDGDFTHEDTMRGVRLIGEHVLPAVREIGRELDLPSAFEVDPSGTVPVADARRGAAS